MNPYLFAKEEALDPLVDSTSDPLVDSNGEALYALGDWTAQRNFNGHGLGILSDCIRCEVTEERNGEYELELEYPMDGWLYKYIENRGIIVAKPNESDGNQPFRIYRISRPINGVVTISARHLSYDLGGVPVGAFTATDASSAVAGLITNAAIPTPFTVTTDISSTTDFNAYEPYSVRGWFGGREGSLIDVYGGEWHYDGYTCELLSARGQDRGVTIKYGVNMVDFEQEESLADMWTGILPFWKDDQTGEVISGHILYADGDFDFEKIQSVDLTEHFPEGEPTMEQLTARGRQYMKENNIGVPEVNITVEWAPSVEQCDLCDTVTVSFEKIGVVAKAKCVRAVYDVLKERYSELQIGNVKPTVADNIAYLNKKVGR